MAFHSIGRGRSALCPRKSEKRVLRGLVDFKEKKLLTRSPTTKELIFTDHDHRMLAIGIVEIEP